MSEERTKIELSNAQKLQLIGLQAVALSLWRQMKEVARAACDITREDELWGGHTDRFLTDADDSVDDLVKRLNSDKDRQG